MDELDRNVIAILQSDGRASNAKIARAVGVSEGTVRRRLRRLIDDDVIQVLAVPNLEQMGYGTSAVIGIQTEPGKVEHVADTITALPESHYVSITTGPYDVFVWVGVESPEQLWAFLKNSVGTIDGVKRLETLVNLTIKKRTHGLIL